MGDKTLTVCRATASSEQAKPDQEIILAQAQQQLAIHKMALQAGGANLPEDVMAPRAPVETPTKVVCLTEVISLSFYAALVVSTDELRDDEEYKEILEHMWEEGEKFGSMVNRLFPRPNPSGVPTPGVGKVFLEYEDTAGSAKAALGGRKFGGRTVVAIYYPEEKYFNRFL